MRVLVVKFGELTLKEYKESNHPEVSAIRNLISQNPIHKFVLVTFTEGSKFRCFRGPNFLIYNLPALSGVQSILSQIQAFLMVCMLRPSLVLGFGLSNNILLSIGAILTRSKFISVVTGELRFGGSSLPKFFYSILLKTVFQKSEVILAISGSVRQELVSDYKIDPNRVLTYRYRIHPMFNPFAPRDLKEILNPNGPIVLTVARIFPEKGLHYLIEASRIVAKRIPNVKFVIKGHTSDLKYKEYLSKLIEEYDLKECITFVSGWVPYNELPKYMVVADVFVLPSISEALGMVVLEAQKCGVPVIATRVGGIPDILIDGVNGLLVEPGDAGGLAEAIIEVLTNEKLKQKFSSYASNSQALDRPELETILCNLAFPIE